MAMASRESRRALALDVRELIWQDKRLDAESYLRTGRIAVYKAYPIPDTPAMREALAKAYREKERLFGAKQKRH